MTTKEKYLIIGVLAEIINGTLDSSKDIDSLYEEFVSIGEKLSNVSQEQKILECEQHIRDCYAELHNQQTISLIPSITPIKNQINGL